MLPHRWCYLRLEGAAGAAQPHVALFPLRPPTLKRCSPLPTSAQSLMAKQDFRLWPALISLESFITSVL